MTEKQGAQTQKNHKLQIPSREEFHRYASDILSNADFCTDYPAGYVAQKIASSIRWTKNNAKQSSWRRF